MLSDENAGDLYFHLFGIYFRKFNVGYCDRLPDLEDIQETFDYTLYRIGQICDDYRTMKELFDKIFLPKVKEEILDICSPPRKESWVLEARIIRPLAMFGLLEVVKKTDDYRSRIKEVRKTPLFDEFVRWEV